MNRRRLVLILCSFAAACGPAFASAAEDKLALGDKVMAAGDAESAFRFYNQAVVLNNNYWKAYLKRGDAAMKLGQREYAMDDYRKVLQLYPGCPQALSRLKGGGHGSKKRSHSASSSKAH